MSIDAIVSLGEDQMTNMFHMVFPTGIPGSTNADAIALRMDQSVDPPEEGVNVYEIFYKGMKIPMTGTTDETDKTISFDVRLDQQWQVWDDLKNYKDMVYNGNNGTRMSNAQTRTSFTVQAVDGSNFVVKSIHFKGAKLRALKISAFDQNGTDPARITLTWVFTKVVYE